MKKSLAILLAAGIAFSSVTPAFAMTTQEKIVQKSKKGTNLDSGVYTLGYGENALDVTSDGIIVSAADADADSQKWVLDKREDGDYEIISLDTGKVLAIDPKATKMEGAAVVVDVPNDAKTQRWNFEKTEDGYILTSSKSKKYALSFNDESALIVTEKSSVEDTFSPAFVRDVADVDDISSSIESISVDKKANEKGRFNVNVGGASSNGKVSSVIVEITPPAGKKKARRYYLKPDQNGDVYEMMTARHFAYEVGDYTVKCSLLLDGVYESEIDTFKVEVPDVLQNLYNKIEDYMRINQPPEHDWQFYLRDCDYGGELQYHVDQQQSASLIKIFVMGAAYEYYDEICELYSKTDVDTNLWNVITVSWDSAWMNLVSYLGHGDMNKGYDRVNEWAHSNGYMDVDTQNTPGHNYTSSKDASQMFLDLYNHKYEHSDDMLYLLSCQTYRHKIPAGVPAGIKTGNKTGDIASTENDTAIVWAPGGTYVLSNMCTGLGDRYTARCTHRAISLYVWEFLEG